MRIFCFVYRKGEELLDVNFAPVVARLQAMNAFLEIVCEDREKRRTDFMPHVAVHVQFFDIFLVFKEFVENFYDFFNFEHFQFLWIGVETRRVDNRHRERDRKSFTLVDVEDLDAVRPSGIFFLDQLKTEFLLYQTLCGNYTATFSKIRTVWRVFFQAPTVNLDSRFSDSLDHLLLTKSDALASEKPPDSS